MPKILVVDDEPNIIELARLYLEREGYQVEGVSNGRDALARQSTANPDLIVLDLMLPDMSGWDILMTIRTSKELRETPVVIMTAVARDGGQHLVRHMKADGYLIKPFDVDALLHQVKRVLGR